MGIQTPSLSYFLTSSDTSLESFELSRLNSVSNLRKEMNDVMEEWVEAEVQARFARMVRQCARLHYAPVASASTEIASPGSQTALHNFQRTVVLLPAAGANRVAAPERHCEPLSDRTDSVHEPPENHSPQPREAIVSRSKATKCVRFPRATVEPPAVERAAPEPRKIATSIEPPKVAAALEPSTVVASIEPPMISASVEAPPTAAANSQLAPTKCPREVARFSHGRARRVANPFGVRPNLRYLSYTNGPHKTRPLKPRQEFVRESIASGRCDTPPVTIEFAVPALFPPPSAIRAGRPHRNFRTISNSFRGRMRQKSRASAAALHSLQAFFPRRLCTTRDAGEFPSSARESRPPDDSTIRRPTKTPSPLYFKSLNSKYPIH